MRTAFLVMGVIFWIVGTVIIGLGMLTAALAILED